MFPFMIFLSATTPLFFKAPCPAVQPVKNFNLTGLASGFWYEIARYPGDFEKNGDCVVVQFKTLKGVKNFQITDVADEHNFSVDGYVESAKNAKDTGILHLYSKDFVDTDAEPDLTVYLLDIDYNNYYIAYRCKYDEATKMRKDYAWISTRSKIVGPATKAKIDSFLNALDQNAHPIDAKQLVWLHFTEDACKVKS